MSVTSSHSGDILTDPNSIVEAYPREYYFGAAYQDYDLQNPPKKMAFYRDEIAKASSVRSPRLLDVGCALGNMLGSLPKSWDLTGVDASSFAISQAKVRVPHAKFHQCEMPPEDMGKFNIITAFDVIEHIEDYEPVLDRIESLLANNGAFVFVVPVYDGIFGHVNRRLDFDVTHVNKWDRHRWLDLTKSRFYLESWAGIFRYLLPNKQYLHFPTGALRTLAPGILVTARKR